VFVKLINAIDGGADLVRADDIRAVRAATWGALVYLRSQPQAPVRYRVDPDRLLAAIGETTVDPVATPEPEFPPPRLPPKVES